MDIGIAARRHDGRPQARRDSTEADVKKPSNSREGRPHAMTTQADAVAVFAASQASADEAGSALAKR